MSRKAVPPSLAAIDRRTLLGRAKDELTESLREHGDATTVAIVLRFIDQLQDVTDRVLFRDYSAEKIRVLSDRDRDRCSRCSCRSGVGAAFSVRRRAGSFRGCCRVEDVKQVQPARPYGLS